ncbi:MAG: hypothetical protein HOH95_12780 [Dehalococcoidia bacterium]|jgi:hypothetical protein|nr:hypothetical protein [Dehalococcoidia bacterium]
MPDSVDTTEAEEQFWAVAAPHLDAPDVEQGTMMGSRCLRVAGEFTSMIDTRNGQLIVKLPAARVLELIDEGTTEPFAPAGRTFKEWTGVLGDTPEGWAPLIEEAVAFARSQASA